MFFSINNTLKKNEIENVAYITVFIVWWIIKDNWCFWNSIFNVVEHFVVFVLQNIFKLFQEDKLSM
jgi:hypothetical protein